MSDDFHSSASIATLAKIIQSRIRYLVNPREFALSQPGLEFPACAYSRKSSSASVVVFVASA